MTPKKMFVRDRICIVGQLYHVVTLIPLTRLEIVVLVSRNENVRNFSYAGHLLKDEKRGRK